MYYEQTVKMVFCTKVRICAYAKRRDWRKVAVYHDRLRRYRLMLMAEVPRIANIRN